MQNPPKIVFISCGSYFSSILSSNNDLYFAGNNLYGQSGLNSDDECNLILDI